MQFGYWVCIAPKRWIEATQHSPLVAVVAPVGVINTICMTGVLDHGGGCITGSSHVTPAGYPLECIGDLVL